MKKRRLFPITLVVLVGLAIIGGVVSAQGGGQDTGVFTQRVAQILNVNETALQDAMIQARQELAQEKVAAAVESGKITQEQAARKLVWIEATPEERKAMRLEKIQSGLAVAVESGKITQEQAARKLVWIEATPEERKAMRLEKIQSGLAVAVESGKITQEQADAKLEALMSKPVGKGHHGQHRHGKPGYRKFGKK